MRISNISLDLTENTAELSGSLDDFRMWFRVPAECPISTRADAFLVAALLPAMLRGEALEIDPAIPVSPRLLEGVQRAQDIYHCWNPAFRKIPIRAILAPAEPFREGAASFFSGGVDSAYTLLQHTADITHLIFLRGFDLSFENQALFGRARKNYEDFARDNGKKLIYLETNGKLACSFFRVGFNPYFGCLLGAIGLALAFPRVYAAAGHTYSELFPWGSHAIVDPLWTTEATQLIHDGAEARRSEKLQAIMHHEGLTRILRVCFEDSDYNCGTCSKCIRTRITLRLLGFSVPTLPPLDSLTPVKSLRISDQADLAFFEDNYRLAKGKADRDLAAILGRHIFRYHTWRYLREVDELLLGGRIRGWRRRWRPSGPEISEDQRTRLEGP